MNRQDAYSTKSEFSCGTGILPVKREDFLRDLLELFLLSPLCSDFGCLVMVEIADSDRRFSIRI